MGITSISNWQHSVRTLPSSILIRANKRYIHNRRLPQNQCRLLEPSMRNLRRYLQRTLRNSQKRSQRLQVPPVTSHKRWHRYHISRQFSTSSSNRLQYLGAGVQSADSNLIITIILILRMALLHRVHQGEVHPQYSIRMDPCPNHRLDSLDSSSNSSSNSSFSNYRSNNRLSNSSSNNICHNSYLLTCQYLLISKTHRYYYKATIVESKALPT